jgi:hypothetical protein
MALLLRTLVLSFGLLLRGVEISLLFLPGAGDLAFMGRALGWRGELGLLLRSLVLSFGLFLICFFAFFAETH